MTTKIQAKPKVYTFVTGGSSDGVSAAALAEDGEHLHGHYSSNAGYARMDMNRPYKHEAYAAKYPDGYEVVWFDSNDPEQDKLIDELCAKNRALAEATNPAPVPLPNEEATRGH